MKIYYPGLLGMHSSGADGLGKVPVLAGGFYKDVPGYFNQITSGRKNNDVCHGSLRSGSLRVSAAFPKSGSTVIPTVGGKHYTSGRYGAWQASAHYTTGYAVVINGKSRLGKYDLGAVVVVIYGIYATEDKRPGQNGRLLCTQVSVYQDCGKSGYGKWHNQGKHPYLPEEGWSAGIAPHGTFPSKDAALNAAISYADDVLESWADLLCASAKELYGQRRGQIRGTFVTDWEDIPTSNEVRASFKLSEPDIYGEGIDPLILGNDPETGSYWRNWLIQQAYYDALSSAPKLSDNSISNAFEILSFMKGLVIDHRIDIPKNLQSAWLSYRYSYSTTKLDAEEAIDFIKRECGSSIQTSGIQCFGMASTDFRGSTITCRVGFRLKNAQLEAFDKAWRALYTYGLQPNFYVVWDMIPYSFIVDWFVPIGDMLSVLDTEASMMRGQYDIKDVVFSLSYDGDVRGYPVHYYTRWAAQPLSGFNEFYWFDKPKSSKKTVAFRIMDTAALFIG